MSCESMLEVGDPDGTRKRPARFYGLPATDEVSENQQVSGRKGPQRTIKDWPVDKKTDKSRCHPSRLTG